MLPPLRSFPLIRQRDQSDCGPACLAMVLKHYGQPVSLSTLRQQMETDQQGSSLFHLRETAQQYGLEAMSMQLRWELAASEELSIDQIPLPAILHWQEQHFVVLYRVSQKKVWLADPKAGKIKLSRRDFMSRWASAESGKGAILLMEPFADVTTIANEDVTPNKMWPYLWQHLRPYRKLLTQVWIGMLAILLIQLVLPFLTQAVVDKGIEQRDLSFITLMLVAQLVLSVSEAATEALQRWIFLYIGTRVNISLISEFIQKLTQLPMRFFQQRYTGDLLQRIADHSRIEEFITAGISAALYAAFSILAFGAVLWYYQFSVFLIFLVGSLLYVLWIWAFLKKRKKVDYLQFGRLSDHQHALLEIIEGIADIKIQGSASKRRRLWQNVQHRLYEANVKYLYVSQWQEVGARILFHIRDIIIIYVTARAVVQGQMTFGMMLAVQFIVGAMSAPLNRLIALIQGAQDARLSLERLAEVHQASTEAHDKTMFSELPAQALEISKLHFRYPGQEVEVLHDIHASIERTKITAIVGPSGSGKTSLLKLLLAFYKPTNGLIRIGDLSINSWPPDAWRTHCTAVMQDGYIFSDSLKGNITEGQVEDEDLLKEVIQQAQLVQTVEELPKGVDTEIGARGMPLSQGQRQRVLLARALYKRADFLFLDEATNALDRPTEAKILNALFNLSYQPTIIMAAHRLSTVQRADHILVLKEGRIVEQGTHKQLIENGGLYQQMYMKN